MEASSHHRSRHELGWCHSSQVNWSPGPPERLAANDHGITTDGSAVAVTDATTALDDAFSVAIGCDPPTLHATAAVVTTDGSTTVLGSSIDDATSK